MGVLVHFSWFGLPVAQVAERQHLRSISRQLLVMPRLQTDTYGRRAMWLDQ